VARVLCPAGRGPSGAVSALWAAAGVHGDHSTEWSATGYSEWGASRMRQAADQRVGLSRDTCAVGQGSQPRRQSPEKSCAFALAYNALIRL
jgi:hypothetical protein